MKHIPGTQLTLGEPIPNIDFGSLPPNVLADRRLTAEEETRRDLTKSYEQLLADSHHEITDPDPNRGPMVNLGFSNRRIAGITARAAIATEVAARESSAATAENIKLQTEVRTLNRRLLWLTIAILAFTVVGAGSAVVQAYYARASYALALHESPRTQPPQLPLAKP